MTADTPVTAKHHLASHGDSAAVCKPLRGRDSVQGGIWWHMMAHGMRNMCGYPSAYKKRAGQAGACSSELLAQMVRNRVFPPCIWLNRQYRQIPHLHFRIHTVRVAETPDQRRQERMRHSHRVRG